MRCGKQPQKRRRRKGVQENETKIKWSKNEIKRIKYLIYVLGQRKIKNERILNKKFITGFRNDDGNENDVLLPIKGSTLLSFVVDVVSRFLLPVGMLMLDVSFW